ncbi:hypothetical protein BGZ96_006139 [Linnemannia gamsii]|uniref:Uncharacterized protein n=1 Tax=Linnemannia gamsii TaxID=64522 RepID=A0ABQ7K3G5_9FUNG|nr:hypothetical protein BGZ96_006139 [Linnemannia gamsii]
MNALVSYASDSDSDSASESGDVHPTTTATVVQKSAPSTPAVTTPTTTTTSSAAPSIHHTPEGTPRETQTPYDQDDTNPPQENKDEQSQQQQQNEDVEEDDDFVSAALKDLQSFAESIDDSTTATPGQGDDTPTTPITTPMEVSPSSTAIPAVPDAQPPQVSDQLDSTDMEVDQPETAAAASATTVPQPESPIELTTEQQIIFDTFLQEINAIPLLPSPSSIDQQPPLPPRISSQSHHDSASTSASTSKTPAGATATTTTDDDEEWIQQQTPQTIYSRIHQLSTLPVTERFSPKEVENRLIEFAIRLLDWEQGGLKPVYFLGQERANKEQRLKGDKKKKTTKEKEEEEGSGDSSSDDDEEEEETMLPGYGGVVGEMVEYMHSVEKIAPPDDHWSIVWSLKELSYSFLHPTTGTKSDEFPSTELRNRLNPPSLSSSTTTPTE